MIGLRISNYLSERGIKQAFIAEKAGMTASQMSDICTGKRKDLNCTEYYKICRALGVDLSTFLDDEEVDE